MTVHIVFGIISLNILIIVNQSEVLAAGGRNTPYIFLRRKKMKFSQALIISLFLTILLPVLVCFGAVTVTFEAGTPAGWDFYDLDADIARNNTVGWDDLGVISSAPA